MGSWRTTLTGFLTVLGAVTGAALIYLKTGTVDTATLVAALTATSAGLGLMKARDNKVSSEEAGAKPPLGPSAP